MPKHLKHSSCVYIYLPQVGVMFGSPEVTSGGNALKFYASMRVDIRKIAPVKLGEEIIGNRVRCKVLTRRRLTVFNYFNCLYIKF